MGRKTGDFTVAIFTIVLVAAGLLGLAAFYGSSGNSNRGDVAPTEDQPQGVQFVTATTQTFDEHVLGSSVPVIVDFYADWCGPCKVQSRILDDVATQLDRGKVVKVDVDNDPELAERFNIEALPTLMVFRDGRVVSKTIGVTSKNELLATLGD
jgi:thioredoxin 1